MSRLVGLVFSVTGIVTAFLIAAGWLWFRPRSNAARRFLVTVVAAYTLASIYAVPFAIGRLFWIGYHQFDRVDAPSGRTAVVVLGAGDEVVQGWDDHLYPMNADAAARVLETWRVFKLIAPAWIISSGGSADRAEPSSINMRDGLVRLGVPADRILLESESQNTHDEAVLIAPMLQSLHVDHVVVVTSDIHMRRSIGAFRAQQIEAVPAIAPDSRSWRPWPYWIVPTGKGLDRSAEVVHELLGMSSYWIRGWWRS